ncbi:tripartite tricarboxylate transporter TctB family protein [Marinomonas ostreistagni]|uniref:tripartite tricarboxylate transporter TctB family protein n=1 Tax=Marinomonas ostreistagni TaxID=359209 RepID=UPI00194E7A16|nr:tripartite tricarboxylate transporter TctB family protein [Marinomonas ostreistagni]MBM6552046.1 tripartite tricarboxylate transporter TctB family protein [Marinomonas ostreistagni]
MSSLPHRYPGERLFSFCLIVFSIFIFWRAYLISGFSELSSPGAVPMGASAVMVLAACIAFAQSLKTPAVEGARFFYHCFPVVVGVMMAFIVLYAVLLEQLGFLVTSALFLFITLKALYGRSSLWTLGLTLGALLVIYVIFRLIFQIILPEGIIPEREILANLSRLFGGA